MTNQNCPSLSRVYIYSSQFARNQIGLRTDLDQIGIVIEYHLEYDNKIVKTVIWTFLELNNKQQTGRLCTSYIYLVIV